MKEAVTTALLVLAGYLAGSIPTGYWLVRATKGVDIRTLGSGNIGGSNVWRVFGPRLGAPVVLLDTAKGFAPALVAAIVVGPLAAVLVLHRANIARLRAGTENRFRIRRRARGREAPVG